MRLVENASWAHLCVTKTGQILGSSERTEPQVRYSMISRRGSGCGFLFRRGKLGFFPANADQLGDAWLLHRHAIKNAAHLHRFAVVGHDDELCLAEIGRASCRER